MSIPNELLYSKEHIWVKTEGNKIRIGITEFAQSELGDIVYVELPELSAMVRENESFGSVESVKTVSELYAPINGKVVEVNKELDDTPDLVNESPFEKAWMLVLELENESDLTNLLSAKEYREMINED